VVLDEHGRPDFERLRRRALIKKSINVTHAARTEPAAFFAFDVLVWRGKDVRSLQLLKRKEIVQGAVNEVARIRPVQYIGEQGRRLYDAAADLKLEGILAKKADSPYRRGRTPNWIKIKTAHGRHIDEERAKWNE
jgi:ATP-dependent DNA ligase